jgi:hypothetical protein
VRALTAKRLRLGWIIPYIGVFELAVYFFQPVFVACVVKDTPSTLQSVAADPGVDYLFDWFPRFNPDFGAMHFTPWRAIGAGEFSK